MLSSFAVHLKAVIGAVMAYLLLARLHLV